MMPLPWMALAENELGVSELSGPHSHPHILEYAKTLKYPMADDGKDAWCAMFVGWTLSNSGFECSGSAAASSYEFYGMKAYPMYGAIALFEWTGGGHHVAFVDNIEGDLIRCLGGNQRGEGPDSVNYRVFDKKFLVGCRWPIPKGKKNV